MTYFHRLILRMLPAPFFGWLATLMFLLLMQFLIRYLPEIVGKGLPFGVIVELIAYNLAYMVVLAVPMSVLIASIMAFGKLAETNAYQVIKSSGVSLPQLIWPAVLVSVLLAIGMWYFNNEVLPEANFRAKNLWQDIRRKKPGFELKPGVFYNGLRGYTILVQNLNADTNDLGDVLIIDNGETSGRQAIIKAERGHIIPMGNGAYVELELEDGELHRLEATSRRGPGERYLRWRFEKLKFRLDLSDFSFERSDPSDGYRSDRTMRSIDMIHVVDSLQKSIDTALTSLFERIYTSNSRPFTETDDSIPTPMSSIVEDDSSESRITKHVALRDLSRTEQHLVYEAALQDARMLRSEIDDARRTVDWEMRRIDRYLVEIHKKNSIAVACLIFMLIGAPLGLSVRRGGLGTAGALAVGIFLFYWITLVQGEKMADRDMLSPWFGMWIANIVMGVVGIWLVLYVTLDLRTTNRFWSFFRSLFPIRKHHE